jgi:hypothetical protein
MRARALLFAAVTGCLGCPWAAQAQTGLVRITIDGGSQTTKTSFTQTRSFDEFVEQGSLTNDRTIPTRPFYDIGAAVRVWRSLHVGVVGSVFTDNGAGSVTAQIPHPLYFNQRRTVNGPAEPGTRRETAAHIQASWTVPVRRGIELTVGGGPSIFQAKQIFVTKVNYTHEYPFDSAKFTSVTTETVKNRVNGYNLGADVTWRFMSHIGVGTNLRYSRGRKTFAVTGGDPVPITLGGLHAGGGLRLMF